MVLDPYIVSYSLTVTAVLTLLLGAMVLTHRNNISIHEYFFTLTVWTAAWIASNALFLVVPPAFRLPVALTSYAFAMLVALYFAIFCRKVENRRNYRISNRSLLAIGWVTALLSATPMVIATEVTDDLRLVTNLPILIIYMIVLVGLFGTGLCALIRKMRTTSRPQERARVASMLIGFVGAMAGGLLCNLFLPFMGNYQFIALGPTTALVFVGFSTYAIVKHGMFDVKSAVVRSITYIAALATLAGGYFLLAYLISMTLLDGANLAVNSANIVIALLLAFMFQPVKRIFDRVTDRIFYRDSYNTSDFVSRLGNILISTTDIHELLRLSMREIESTIKIDKISTVVHQDNGEILAVGDHPRLETARLHEVLDAAAAGKMERVILTDALFADYEAEHSYLSRAKIAAIVPLGNSESVIGYLLLGEQRSGKYSVHDIRALETISNEFAIAVQNAMSVRAVRDFNKDLEKRISIATKELRRSNKRLLELDATKDEFVSMASHQLRTPLTSVKGYISMVLEGDAGKVSPQQRQLLEEAFISSERMVHLIGDFLNVSRLQTGKFMIERRECDLAKVVEQEVEGMVQVAQSHGIKLVYRQPRVFPLLYLDEGKIRQVIMNFIDNAIYYSPESTSITIKLSVADSEVIFEVTDKGMGVPKNVQAQLFTKFFRAENARKQRPDGTGIGLYLAKKIVDGHKGKIIFSSTEGRGSTFGFRLPVRKLSLAPAHDADNLDDNQQQADPDTAGD